MGRNLLIIGMAVSMIVGSTEAKETTPPVDMEFIEFLGTFDKDVDPLMLSSVPKSKNVPPKSPPRGSSYGKKDTKQKDNADE
jgi:hypothetical protein